MNRRAGLAVAGLALVLSSCSGSSEGAGGADAGTSTTTATVASSTTTTAATTTTTEDPAEAAAFADQFEASGFDSTEAACLGSAAARLTGDGEAPTLQTEISAFAACDIDDDRLAELGLLERIRDNRAAVRQALVDHFVERGATEEDAACIADGAIPVLGGAAITPANRDLLVPVVEACDVDPAAVGL